MSQEDCPHCQKYYRLRNVAEPFEISEKTIPRMITEGRLKTKRIHGSIPDIAFGTQQDHRRL